MVCIDTSHIFSTPLLTPAALMEELPASTKNKQAISTARKIITAIMQGLDPRLLVIVGPCSIHDIDASLEYARKLKQAATEYADKLFIVMRVYFEKPRTTTGWRGFINDPFLNGTHDMQQGLRLARSFLVELANLGLPTGTEFLDTLTPLYFGDLISWAAIGARTSASQTHRELASGLAMPVGFKNNTDGNIQIAIDAVKTIRNPHHYLGSNEYGNPAMIKTPGNSQSHIILRGSNTQENYHASNITLAEDQLNQAGLPPFLMVDCSHGNSMKHYKNQIKVVASLALQIKSGNKSIRGVMIESHLKSGNQPLDINNLIYGQSITDECLSWDETEPLLAQLADL